jgi:DinB superfamily
MLTILKQSLWNQFGASIEMLENAIIACPYNLWDTETKFWYNAYHSLFFLDYYLTLNPIKFMPPPPFTQSEFEDSLPPRTYSKEELLTYLRFCREKCQSVIAGLTDEIAISHWTNASQTMSYPVVEILLYNMRHVQHHAAQLNLLLRQGMNEAPEWVFQSTQDCSF